MLQLLRSLLAYMRVVLRSDGLVGTYRKKALPDVRDAKMEEDG